MNDCTEGREAYAFLHGTHGSNAGAGMNS